MRFPTDDELVVLGMLRADLLSCCYACGYAAPTAKLPDDRHRYEFSKGELTCQRQFCPRCGDRGMIPHHYAPERTHEWLTRKSLLPRTWEPLVDLNPWTPPPGSSTVLPPLSLTIGA